MLIIRTGWGAAGLFRAPLFPASSDAAFDSLLLSESFLMHQLFLLFFPFLPPVILHHLLQALKLSY